MGSVPIKCAIHEQHTGQLMKPSFRFLHSEAEQREAHDTQDWLSTGPANHRLLNVTGET